MSAEIKESSLKKRWQRSLVVSAPELAALAAEYNIAPEKLEFLSKLVNRRNLETSLAAKNQKPEELLTQAIQQFTLLDNAEGAISRIVEAVNRGEKIALSSDYDADGNFSAAIMVVALMQFGVPRSQIIVHVPNREEEGYGINIEAVRQFKEEGASLIITMDNGTAANDPIREATSLGMDVVVLDHHGNSLGAEAPQAAEGARGKLHLVNANLWTQNYQKKAEEEFEEIKHVAPMLRDVSAGGITWLTCMNLLQHIPCGPNARKVVKDWLPMLE